MTQTLSPTPAASPVPSDAGKPPRPPYRIAGPDTWAMVREAYLAGLSARRCAERYGVGVSNLKRRAREEGWTRRDHALRLDAQRRDTPPPGPFPAPFPAPPFAEGASDPTPWRPDPAEAGPAPLPLDAVKAALEEASRRAARGEGRGALEMLKAADALLETDAVAQAHCEKINADWKQTLDLADRAERDRDERQRSEERRRQFAREAELREAEHQAQLARLRLQPPGDEPPPDETEAPDPTAEAAEPAPTGHWVRKNGREIWVEAQRPVRR